MKKLKSKDSKTFLQKMIDKLCKNRSKATTTIRTLRNKNATAIWFDMTELTFKGWKVIQLPEMNFWGTYVCKLQKPKAI